VESRIDLEKLMAQLKPKARKAVQFVKLDGLSVSEAAALSGMSESAVKVSVHRGLKALSLLATQRSRS
jgi:RNA polymerase sigma-70 factor (ECF subfamily)